MKTIICKCNQCLLSRKYSRIHKRDRVQTYQVRAERSKVKEMLKTLPIDEIESSLPEKVSVDYYA